MSADQSTIQNKNLSDRYEFVEMDAETRTVLRGMRPLIMKNLPAILGEFYDQVYKFPDVARLFPNEGVMQHAKEMQLKHWDTIAAADFSDDYVQSVNRIGETHNRLGLDPRWYIGGYSFILTRLLAVIEQQAPASRFGRNGLSQKSKMLGAVVKATLLDMDFAISIYLDAGKRERNVAIEQFATSFQNNIGGIVTAVSAASTQLEASAATLTKNAEITQSITATAATASQETSVNVQSVASASEELASSVVEVGRQVEISSQIAAEAVGQAEETNIRITALSEAAGRIGDIVKLITNVAEQTNLLALNATIEAARAGEAGRGFAVVAHEVKSLAAQTGKATDEIKLQIEAMQAETTQSVGAIRRISTTINRVSEIATAIAAAVEEQIAATKEIAYNVQKAATGTSDVAGSMTDVNGRAIEAENASSGVLTAAQSLSAESAHLKSEVEKFINTVRAA